MPNLEERLSELDLLDPPDVWSDVQRMGPIPPVEQGPSTIRRASVVLLALGLALGALLLVDRAFKGHGVEPGHTHPSPTTRAVPGTANGLIAFDCGFRICTVAPDGSGFRNLIASYDKGLVLTAYSPVFSPDGSKIAFRGYPKGGTSGGGANYDIYVMNADGSGVTNLTTSPADIQGRDSQGSPAWSPDGSMIAYDGPGVYVMNADGSDQRKLSDGTAPTWSPDGSRIAFVFNGGLWTIEPDGNGLRQLTQGSISAELPVWSPDGSQLAFLHGSVLYVVNADGTGLTSIVERNSLQPFQPQWSPNGKTLVFEALVSVAPGSQGHSDYNYDIFSVGADATNLTDLTPTTDLTENYPIWSPDGSRVAFAGSSVMTGENTGTFDLYTMKTDGTGIERLTTNAGLGVEFDISWQRSSG